MGARVLIVNFWMTMSFRSGILFTYHVVLLHLHIVMRAARIGLSLPGFGLALTLISEVWASFVGLLLEHSTAVVALIR